ncbi:MAG TPA: methyltransferase domain-containing protein [Stellaceae bacterium]|nr:methyltransferase domain-containing protein [Stellaceae bacterium]
MRGSLRVSHLSARLDRIEEKLSQLSTRGSRLEEPAATPVDASSAFAQLQQELSAQLSFSFHDLAQRLFVEQGNQPANAVSAGPVEAIIEAPPQADPSLAEARPAVGPMEPVEPFLGLRGVPRRIFRGLRRMRALLRVPDVLPQVDAHVRELESRISGQLTALNRLRDEFNSAVGVKQAELIETFNRIGQEINEAVSLKQAELLEADTRRGDAFISAVSAKQIELLEALNDMGHELRATVSAKQEELLEADNRLGHEFITTINQKQAELVDALNEIGHEVNTAIGLKQAELLEADDRLGLDFISAVSRKQAELLEALNSVGRELNSAVSRKQAELLEANNRLGHDLSVSVNRKQTELLEALNRLGQDFNSAVSLKQIELLEADNRIGQEFRVSVSQKLAELLEALNRLGGEFNNAVSAKQAEMVEALNRIGGELQRLANEQFESKNHLIHLGTNTESRFGELLNVLQRVANEQFESKNQLIHFNRTTESRLEELISIGSETRNTAIHSNTSLHTRLDTIENVRFRNLYNQMQDFGALLMRLRARSERREPLGQEQEEASEPSAQHQALDAYLRMAQRDFPRIYPLWAERLEGVRREFLQTKVGNAAHAGDPASEMFRSLVEIHATGRVLDVGCGVFGRPHYLSSYPAKLLSGLDPLTPLEPPDFEFVQGIQEYLPWNDASFSTVISATSLDHCLSLDRSLAEIRRVLRPGGRFIIWFSSNAGARPYEPDAPDFTPADAFHLFHFDIAWFEPMLQQWFDVVDRIELRGLDFSHVMSCLELREEKS